MDHPDPENVILKSGTATTQRKKRQILVPNGRVQVVMLCISLRATSARGSVTVRVAASRAATREAAAGQLRACFASPIHQPACLDEPKGNGAFRIVQRTRDGSKRPLICCAL
eukprot:2861141-Pleurochrysis_carterae.AAC.7